MKKNNSFFIKYGKHLARLIISLISAGIMALSFQRYELLLKPVITLVDTRVLGLSVAMGFLICVVRYGSIINSPNVFGNRARKDLSSLVFVSTEQIISVKWLWFFILLIVLDLNFAARQALIENWWVLILVSVLVLVGAFAKYLKILSFRFLFLGLLFSIALSLFTLKQTKSYWEVLLTAVLILAIIEQLRKTCPSCGAFFTDILSLILLWMPGGHILYCISIDVVISITYEFFVRAKVAREKYQ